MSSISKTMREERMRASYNQNDVVDIRVYNAVMGGVVLYGLLVNVLLCYFVGDIYDYVNPIVFLILYFVLAFGGIAITKMSNNPFISFLGYNMVVVPFGLVISTMVKAYGGIGDAMVLWAFVDTLIISAVMVLGAILFPQFFASIGKALFFALIGIVIASLISFIFAGAGSFGIALISAIVFSLYIGYDFYRSQQFPKTIDNAIDCALDIYVDIANLFIDLLRIFGNSKD